MAQRVWGVLATVAGLVVLAALVLAGVDVYRAARTGPRWRRRLVGAGLVLMAALGLAPAGCESSIDTTAAVEGEAATAGSDLPATREWNHLTAAWREAEEVGTGRRGPYPFDEAGKKDLLARLSAVEGDLAALEKAGCLSAAEAAALRADLPRLVRGVETKRTAKERMFTCYDVYSPPPARGSLERLRDRLVLLEPLAEAKTVHPEVVYKVLGVIEADLAVLGDEKALAGLKEKERTEAIRVRDAAKAAVDKIRARAGGAATRNPTESAEWKTILAMWRQVEPLATSGKSTMKERKAADAALAKAEAAARDLALAGTISVAEAELIAARGTDLRSSIYRERPTDSQVRCYRMMFVPPAKVSLDHLRDRLPLLRQMVEQGKVRPEVVARLLPSLEADLNVLRDPKALKALNKDDQVEAGSRVEQTLKMLKTLVGANE